MKELKDQWNVDPLSIINGALFLLGVMGLLWVVFLIAERFGNII